jgi:NAD(P)-dependent dehydrogenase (short-subunit alcohol dehydrogenase family)
VSANVAVVTGANSGIGRATAIHLATKGLTVYGTVRSVGKADKLRAMAADAGVQVELVELDVADDESVAHGFAQILARVETVDLLVNNAGVGPIAVAEHCPTSLYLDTVNVNLCGPVRCTQAVLPGMRARRRGCIVNIGSFTGKVATMAQSPYAAAKFALEGWTDGLAQEVAPFGIRVALLEPGVTRTAIQAKNSEILNESGAYDAQYRRMFRFYVAGLSQPGTDPFGVAEVVHEAFTTTTPRLRYVCSWGAAESIEGRARMSDADWVGLGAIADDDEYYERFQELFGLDIGPT